MYEKYISTNPPVYTLEGGLWNNMRTRCKVGGAVQASAPRYNGCTMSENFQSFQFFANWCQSQPGFGLIDEKGNRYQLDKDILSGGRGFEYSETACVFVPAELNCVLTSSNAIRGKFPRGVHFHNPSGKYMARCKTGDGAEATYLGTYLTPEAAFEVYKAFKERIVRERAIKYKGTVDPRVIAALLTYEVNYED